MQNAFEKSFQAHCAYIREYIYPQFIELAAERGVDITTEDLDVRLGMKFVSAQTLRKQRKKVIRTGGIDNGCQYMFKRGDHVNEICGKPRVTGSNFCSSCIKKGVPIKKITPTSTTSNSPDNQQTVYQVNVVAYEESKGLYRNPEHNFIIKQMSDQKAYCLGRLDTITNKIIELTDEERRISSEMGLSDPPQGQISSIPALHKH